ncbi:MAG: transposase [Planctomycetaceae bacterium]|nr:transposase [Planctomycetaceae bacterium]
MYLVSNNLELSTEELKTLYKKRWSVEEYHKSLNKMLLWQNHWQEQ